MKMKKILKVVLGVVVLGLLTITITEVSLYLKYKDWLSFDQAISNNDIVKMQAMLQNGYNINKTLRGRSHLLNGIANENMVKIETIEYIIKNGADINYAENKNFYPLFAALMLNRTDIFKLLIDNGANTEIKANGLSLLETARILGRSDIIPLIPSNNIEISTDTEKM